MPLEWARSVLGACRAMSVPLFMKQITHRGRKIPFESWPADLKIREYPQAYA
jgi:hypothetical protein